MCALSTHVNTTITIFFCREHYNESLLCSWGNFQGYFGQFLGFEGILDNFFEGILVIFLSFGVIFKFWEYFGLFLRFKDILVIFLIFEVFWTFLRFWGYFGYF